MINTFYNHLQDDIRWEGYRYLLAQKGISTINQNNEHYDALFLLKILSIQEAQGLSLRQLAHALQRCLSLSHLLRLPPKPNSRDNDKEQKSKDSHPDTDHHNITQPLPDEEILQAFRGQLKQQHLIEPLIQHLYDQLPIQGSEGMSRSDKSADEETIENDNTQHPHRKPDETQTDSDHDYDTHDDYDYNEYYEDAFTVVSSTSKAEQNLCPECGSSNVRQRPQSFWNRLLGRDSSYVCLCCANKFD